MPTLAGTRQYYANLHCNNMSSHKEKWLMVEWGNGARGVVNSRYALNRDIMNMRAGDTITIRKRGERQIATFITRSNERLFLEKILKDEAGPPIPPEPEFRDFSPSDSSCWEPSGDEDSDASEVEAKKPKLTSRKRKTNQKSPKKDLVSPDKVRKSDKRSPNKDSAEPDKVRKSDKRSPKKDLAEPDKVSAVVPKHVRKPQKVYSNRKKPLGLAQQNTAVKVQNKGKKIKTNKNKVTKRKNNVLRKPKRAALDINAISAKVIQNAFHGMLYIRDEWNLYEQIIKESEKNEARLIGKFRPIRIGNVQIGDKKSMQNKPQQPGQNRITLSEIDPNTKNNNITVIENKKIEQNNLTINVNQPEELNKSMSNGKNQGGVNTLILKNIDQNQINISRLKEVEQNKSNKSILNKTYEVEPNNLKDHENDHDIRNESTENECRKLKSKLLVNHKSNGSNSTIIVVKQDKSKKSKQNDNNQDKQHKIIQLENDDGRNEAKKDVENEPMQIEMEQGGEDSGEESDRSDDNVLISNKYENIKYKNSGQHNPDDWVPIGSGMTLIHKDKFKKVKWSSYTIATRTLLLSLFKRRTLATHSLTGKKSPAFQNKPAKMCLDPKKISDIVMEVVDRFNVKENLVRSIITTKCADESKMFRTRLAKRNSLLSKQNEKHNESNKENRIENI